MWNIEMTKHLKPEVSDEKPEVLDEWVGTINFCQPERGKWQVHLFGDSGIIYYPLKGNEPNWFWRKMQYLIFGNRWIKTDD